MLSELALWVLLRVRATNGPTPTVSVSDHAGHRIAPESDLAPGEVLTITGHGFLPNRPVQVAALDDGPPSDPSTADANGDVHIELTVPVMVRGRHVLALVGTVPDSDAVSASANVTAGVPQLATFPFTSGAQRGTEGGPATYPSALAYTGSDVRRLAVAGVLVTAAGVAVSLLARRRAGRAQS